VAVAAVKVRVKPAAKAQRVHRATARLHLAETGHRAHKAQRALKVKAKAAEKVVGVTVVAAKNNVATPVLTTVAMAKAVPHHVVHVLRAVARVAAHKAAMAVVLTLVVKVAAKTVAATMATNCPATSTL
jgi:hypothetical protein